MTIVRRPCPRCAGPNTVRLSDAIAACLNCRASWPRRAERRPAATDAAPPVLEYPFSARELARLAVYRAAVAAGFYNDGV